jgi:leader peptidase (prepilin peptidase)/N-methyltransferase
MIHILETIFAGLLGLAFGSFLNVCLSRWPEGESVVLPRSHCRQCDRTLTWWENVPLASWLALGGRCRTCRAWIGWRYPLVELAIGVLWAVSAWQLPNDFLEAEFSAAFFDSLFLVIGKMLLFWLLVALAVLDLENFWLPNILTLPGTAAGFLFTVLSTSQQSLLPAQAWTQTALRVTERAATFDLLGILAAAGLILLMRWIYWLVRHREGVGLGDVKLMALLAAWLGFPGALLAFGFGTVLGALVALVLLVIPSVRTESKSWAQTKLPLGTFLCIGGIVSSLWSEKIISAYLRWAGF